MTTTATTPVRAIAYPDDSSIKVKFDASPWLKLASNQQILNIVACEYGGDYATDNIALEYPQTKHGGEKCVNKALKEMFKYIDIARKFKDIGFECKVEEVDVLAWIKLNRPELVPDVVRIYNTMFTDGWDFPIIANVHDIAYDADDMNDVADLPTSMFVEIPPNEDDESEYLSEWITNHTGFCHDGFLFNVIP